VSWLPLVPMWESEITVVIVTQALGTGCLSTVALIQIPISFDAQISTLTILFP
jgi:hypothetical protein